MDKLGNYITGRWVNGDGDGQTLFNAVDGEIIGSATSKGLDFKSIVEYQTITVCVAGISSFTDFMQNFNELKSANVECP